MMIDALYNYRHCDIHSAEFSDEFINGFSTFIVGLDILAYLIKHCFVFGKISVKYLSPVQCRKAVISREKVFQGTCCDAVICYIKDTRRTAVFDFLCISETASL